MNKNGWMVLVVIAGLAFVLAFSGCARTPEMPESTLTTELEPAEGMGMEEVEVITEEIEPIQPKEITDIGFEFDRFDLSPEARATLADNAAWLENHPGVSVMIEGHCDERGTNEYNLALGDRRAKSAYNYLINLGVSPRRISTISYGEERPACSYATESCWSKNRRAHFATR